MPTKKKKAKVLPAKRPITPNQKLFCLEWLKDRNGTRAYLAAYKGCKTEAAARVNASKLLTKANIKSFLAKRLKKHEKQLDITVDRLKREEGRIAFSDVTALFDGKTTIAPADLPKDVRRAISGIKVHETETGEGENKTVKRTYEYKFWNKGQALERLERHLGMFERDNAQKAGDGVSIQVLVQNKE